MTWRGGSEEHPLRTARRRAGLSIDQLAVSAGMGGASVSRIECGRTSPQRTTKAALAAALGVPVDELFPTGTTGARRDAVAPGS